MAAFHDDLLEQSRHLAVRESRRPKQGSLRRAVSTAYYALFHHLIFETVRNWKQADQRADFARAFSHGAMRTACEAEGGKQRKRLKGQLSTAQQPVAAALLRIAETFVEMQQNRHAADYDVSRNWSRTETIAKIELVEAASADLESIRREREAQHFLLSLFIKKR